MSSKCEGLNELTLTVCKHNAPTLLPQAGSRDASHADESIIGLVPHQLRRFLAQSKNILIVGAAYDCYTGCSEKVVQTFEKEGFDMLLQAFNDTKYLLELTGLKQIYEETQAANANGTGTLDTANHKDRHEFMREQALGTTSKVERNMLLAVLKRAWLGL